MEEVMSKVDKHPITVVLTKDYHDILVKVAKVESRPPAQLARVILEKKLMEILGSLEDLT